MSRARGGEPGPHAEDRAGIVVGEVAGELPRRRAARVGPQPLRELARVDRDGAGGLAEPVGGAGLVAEVGPARLEALQALGVGAALAQARDLPARDDPLTRREGEVPRRTPR